MQTLCVLHRYNRRGPGSWYPEIIFTRPDASAPPPATTRPGDEPLGGSESAINLNA